MVADPRTDPLRRLPGDQPCRRPRGKTYEYPRYFFSNESDDIQAIFTTALDRVGVPWRNNRGNSVSIARRAGVARMDQHVGPKR